VAADPRQIKRIIKPKPLISGKIARFLLFGSEPSEKKIGPEQKKSCAPANFFYQLPRASAFMVKKWPGSLIQLLTHTLLLLPHPQL
jgi:hypothetical protein